MVAKSSVGTWLRRHKKAGHRSARHEWVKVKSFRLEGRSEEEAARAFSVDPAQRIVAGIQRFRVRPAVDARTAVKRIAGRCLRVTGEPLQQRFVLGVVGICAAGT